MCWRHCIRGDDNEDPRGISIPRINGTTSKYCINKVVAKKKCSTAEVRNLLQHTGGGDICATRVRVLRSTLSCWKLPRRTPSHRQLKTQHHTKARRLIHDSERRQICPIQSNTYSIPLPHVCLTSAPYLMLSSNAYSRFRLGFARGNGHLPSYITGRYGHDEEQEAHKLERTGLIGKVSWHCPTAWSWNNPVVLPPPDLAHPAHFKAYVHSLHQLSRILW